MNPRLAQLALWLIAGSMFAFIEYSFYLTYESWRGLLVFPAIVVAALALLLILRLVLWLIEEAEL